MNPQNFAPQTNINSNANPNSKLNKNTEPSSLIENKSRLSPEQNVNSFAEQQNNSYLKSNVSEKRLLVKLLKANNLTSKTDLFKYSLIIKIIFFFRL